jgi:two-component system response regulator MprA
MQRLEISWSGIRDWSAAFPFTEGTAKHTVVRLLVIDENAAIHAVRYRDLVAEGYEVELARSENQGLEKLAGRAPDAVVIAARLGDVEVLEVCRRVRKLDLRTPVLVIDASESVQERVAALDAGADDYLSHPVDRRELSARLKALLRRALDSWPEPEPLSVANVSLDPVRRGIAAGREFAELTRIEYGLMELFLNNPERLLPYGEICGVVWPGRSEALTNLRVYVGYLRGKLAHVGGDLVIEATSGRGYVMRGARTSSGGSTQCDVRSDTGAESPRTALAAGLRMAKGPGDRRRSEI